jgi:2-dehydro-3-deoxy-D-arabinonate dehydratase
MPIDRAILPASPALCRFRDPGRPPSLGWWDGDNLSDLSATALPSFASLSALLASADSILEMAERAVADAPRVALDDVTLLAPIDGQEIWAAGVTYERSRAARMSESEAAADMYWRVYDAERPELFFKADARRTRGPDEAIRVRYDSRWTVPEPELTLVLTSSLHIAGFTIGNDVSARDIEGENPLYLPQAKLYDGSAALGPWIVPVEAIADPYALQISCRIIRGGTEVWRDTTTTGQLHRRLDDLVSYLGRSDSFPSGAFLMTGTCLVPPDALSLRAGDEVEVAIDGLGVLYNSVA